MDYGQDKSAVGSDGVAGSSGMGARARAVAAVVRERESARERDGQGVWERENVRVRA